MEEVSHTDEINGKEAYNGTPEENVKAHLKESLDVLFGSYAWPVCHFQICTGVSIEKCCLSAVRISDEADSQIFSHRNLPH